MKRLILLIPFIFLCPKLAKAETIRASDSLQYISELKAAYNEPSMYISSSDSVKSNDNPDSQRTLMVSYDEELNDDSALCDIWDIYGTHTLIYPDKKTADKAYEYYDSNDIPVCHDEQLSVTASTYLSWGPEFIGTPYFTDGLKKDYGSVSNMPDITVAVIDSGIDYTHSFLSSRVDADKGYDFYNNDSDAKDDNNHGTHVAGIIADNTLSNVTIVPIKVTNKNGSLTSTDLYSGIMYAIDINSDVINMSLASTEEDSYLRQKSVFRNLFNSAYNKGITICVAAGNASDGVVMNANYIFPSYMDHTISVANCTSGGSISSSSNYGSVIDISAPGSSIRSTIINNKFSYMSGTSMACPFVSAAAALLKTKNNAMTPTELENELCSNATPYSAEFEDDYAGKYGTGILNLSNYYTNSEPTATPLPTQKPTPTPAPTESPTTPPAQIVESGEYLSNGKVRALIKNYNNILSSGAIAIIAGYKDDVLIRTVSTTVNSDGDDAAFSIYFDSNTDKYDSIKLFIWQDQNNCHPLSNLYTLK